MIYSLFFIVAFIIIIVIVSVMNYKIISGMEEQTFQSYLTNSIISVDNKLKDMSRVSLMSTSGDRFQNILLNYKKRNTYEKNQDEEYLNEYYTSLIEIRNDISGIYIFDMNNLIFRHDKMNPSLRKDVDAYEVLYEVEQKTVKLEQSNCYLAVDSQPRFMRYPQNYGTDQFNKNCIWLLRDIYRFSPHDQIGSVALTVPVETIKKILDEGIGEDMFYILLTKSGDIACCQNGDFIGRNIKNISPTIAERLTKEEGQEAEWEGEICKIMIEHSDYSNLILITGQSVIDFTEEATGFIWYSVLIGLCVVILIVILTICYVSVMMKPLKALAQGMSNFDEHSLKIQYPIVRNDEIGQMVNSYNSMVNMLDHLIETQYIDKMRIKESQLNEQKLSFLYLKSQVNPHFLYNTLDTIRIRAEINNDKDVSYMLMELVKFFRLNVKAEYQFVNLEHEINLIDAYLKLMCYRYENITYQYDIDNNLLDVLVPNFILQPIVENSLLHGLRDKGYIGQIYLSVHRCEKEDRIEITIKDDGVGMSTEIKEHINELLQDYDSNCDLKEQNNLGILNVQKRLKMFYEEDCGLYYTDNEEGGVSAHIIIEKKYEFNSIGG